MSNDVKLEPEAIWLSPRCDTEAPHGEGRLWANPAPEAACDDCGLPWVKYVRADLAPPVGVEPGEVPPSATLPVPLAALRHQPQREAVLEEANIERVARAMDPPLWADHVETAHMAASPLQVCYARERSLERARLFLTEYAALTTPAPAVSRDETNLADELERLLNKRADRSVPGGRVHDELTHFVEKHRVAILSRLRGEGE